MNVLKALMEARPDSSFVASLHGQYCVRGSLSKKQLEGLVNKAQKVNSISKSNIATIEAIIRKMPNRYKSEKPDNLTEEKKDDSLLQDINLILDKFPQHKMVLFLKAKFESNEPISPDEKSEITRLKKVLLK